MKTSAVQYSAFIAYAPEDREKAQQVEASLQVRGLRCWLGPAGQREPAETEQAMNNSRCLVLLLSSAANDNAALRDLVADGVKKAKPVFPVRIEQVMPAPELALHVSSAGWVDAWSGRWVDHLDKLCGEIASGVAPNSHAAPPSHQVVKPEAEQPVKSKRSAAKIVAALGVVAILALFLLAGLGVGGYFLFGEQLGLYAQDKPTGQAEEAEPDAPIAVDAPGAPDAARVAVDPVLSVEQLLDRLLLAIDAEDYEAVSAYAHALFVDRRDLEIAAYRGRLQPPVLAAAREGNVDLFVALLHARPVISLEDDRGREPIHIAAAQGHDPLLRLLISEVKIDPDKPTDSTRFTPLHWAAQTGQPASIDALLQSGADSQARSTRGQTPLHIAVQSNQMTAIQALLKHAEVDVNATDANGRSPLHLAALNGKAMIVEMLIKSGANRNAQDVNGQTPAQLAFKSAHDDIANRLGY